MTSENNKKSDVHLRNRCIAVLRLLLTVFRFVRLRQRLLIVLLCGFTLQALAAPDNAATPSSTTPTASAAGAAGEGGSSRANAARPADQSNQNNPSTAPNGTNDSAADTSRSSAGNGNSVSVKSLNDEAFGSMTQAMLPMTPAQIQQLRQLFNQTQAAAVTTPGTPPRPTISSQYVRLEPGATPSVIRLAQGYVTTLAFLDATGQPWPVDNYDIGNPQAFNIQWDKKSNLLMIQAAALYNVGNLAVQLRGLTTPVMVTLISGQKAVDYRIDLRIPGYGPNAKTLLGRSLPRNTSPILLSVLEGVSPKGYTPLKICGGPAQAWYDGGERLYLRTRLTLISPAWIATMSSPDGMKAYEMPKTPLILGYEDGQSVQLKVEGF